MSSKDDGAVEPGRIAIIGVSGRFPGADDVSQFWKNLCDGIESIKHFGDAELEDCFDEATRRSPSYVKARAILSGADQFDAGFFGMHANEAALTDPQHRVFLECAWEAFEDAGYDPATHAGPVGVFAGCSINTYFLNNICADRRTIEDYTGNFQVGCYHALLGSGREFLATRASYKLGLTGPSITVQTACSTSLVAVIQACQSLLLYQCDMALAGGVSITFPQKRGYLHQEGGMVSADGRCRPFDAEASGTVFGDGAAIVLLKRLEDALADRDHIYAVIRGCGINNDGADKVGFTAPSVNGQAQAIEAALAEAGVDARSIGYVECHGTATPLGDPIEVAALTKAFKRAAGERQFCAIGSVKGNIGHLDAAAGAAGLIKTALSLKYGIIPATLHFKAPNPHIDFSSTPFVVNAQLTRWDEAQTPRLAGVSSLGVGGTNAHIILEEPPSPKEVARKTVSNHLLLLSARSKAALTQARLNLSRHIENHPEQPLADIAHTLRMGRRHFPYRCALVCGDRAEAVSRLAADHGWLQGKSGGGGIAFMFPGQGAQFPAMGRGLYDHYPEFRRQLDICAEILKPLLGKDLRKVLYASREAAAEELTETILAQPAIFSIEFALAKLWESWGLRPCAMIGHSIGEFAAACIAGVFSLDDALRIVAVRGQLLQALPPGGMLAVRLPEKKLAPLLDARLSIAAINSRSLCVVSGPPDSLSELGVRLKAAGIAYRPLRTSHAFHSVMADPVVAPLAEELRKVRLSPPAIPFVSCVTGGWIHAGEATSPEYWARHAREPVRFSQGIGTLLQSKPGCLLETGPGNTLVTLAAQSAHGENVRLVASLPESSQEGKDAESLMEALGSLWIAGAEPDWKAVFGEGRRVALPTYPFERSRYWIEPPKRQASESAAPPEKTEASQMSSADASISERAIKPMSLTPANQLDQNGRSPAHETVRASLIKIFEDLSGENVSSAPDSMSFLEMGFDSLFLSQAAQRIEKEFKIKITFRQLLAGQSTLPALSSYLEERAWRLARSPKEPAEPSNGSAFSFDNAISALPALPQAATTPSRPEVEGFMREQLQAFSELMSRQLETLRQMGFDQPASGSRDPVHNAANATARGSDQSKQSSRFEVYASRRKPGEQSLTPAEKKHIADLAERFTRKTAQSKRLAETYRRVLADPRAVSGFRPEWKELVYPIVVSRAKGARIWDVDGNEYIDLVNGYGQTAFGHTPDFVADAVKQQLDKGFAIGPQAELAGRIAELFTELTGHERMTFCNTGSEAVMAAMRVARCVSGREKIAVFNGAYHGQFDEVLLKGVKGSGSRPLSLPIAPGIPRSAVENMIVLDYGTPASLQWLEKNTHDLAAVMVEPVQSRHPDFQPFEFLRKVREITEAGGTVFIMDEVVTGFRAHPGGIQALTGIRADLAAYGKVVGGGLPIGILAGKAQFMDALDGGAWRYGDDSVPEVGVTFFAGTFVRHPLVLAAVWAVLNHLKNHGPDLLNAVAKRAGGLAKRLNAIFQDYGLQAKVEQFSSFLYFTLANEHPLSGLLFYHLRDRGIYIQDGFPCFLTTMHGDEEIEKIILAFEDSFAELAEAGITKKRRVSREEIVPLTESQMEIWLAAQHSDEASCAFNESVTLRMNGELNEAALERALNRVVARHDALRGRFSATGEEMRIAQELRLDLQAADADREHDPEAVLAAIVAEDARTPFDLVNGPLIRARLVRLSRNGHALILTVHHIICDGWSLNVLLEELAEIYTAAIEGGEPNLAQPMQFGAYARKQARTHQTGTEAFWLNEFGDSPPLLELPVNRPRSESRSYNGASICRRIDAGLYRAVKAAGAREKCTSFVTLLAAFQALMGRLAGQNEVTTGIPMAGQASFDEPLIGHCVNFLPIRSRWTETTSIADHLAAVAKTVLDASEHQNYTFGTLVRKLNLSRQAGRLPVTEIQFNLERLPEALRMPGLAVEVSPNPKAFVNFDIFFNIIESNDGLRIDCDYNTRLFDETTICGWLDRYTALLQTIAADASEPLIKFPPRPGRGLAAAGINGPPLDYPKDRCIHQLFEDQAAKRPDAIAVTCGDARLSYGELDRRANQLANYILARTRGLGERIGVITERSTDMVVALLATLKAGYAYLPLDPSHPSARLRHILAEAGAVALLTDSELELGLVPPGASVIQISRDRNAILAEPAELPTRSRTPDNPAYVIYTSGSTGKPKGVEVAHRPVVNFLCSETESLGFSARDIVFAVTTIAFDTSVFDLFLPLANGATVALAESKETADGYLMLSRLKSTGATFMQATPASWRLLLEAGFRSWPGFTMISIGEALPRSLANQLLKGGGVLWNMYGPTETTVWSSGAQITPGEEPISIGRPIANTQFYILGSDGQPLPAGKTGELHIGGDGLARGYLNRPELTAEKFIQNPFGPGRLYKTGDLAQYLPSGDMLIFGRLDNQVKLRGFRIELGEIEAVLANKAPVAASAVALREDGAGNLRLIGYYVEHPNKPVQDGELRDLLAQDLPDYMIPTLWMRLDKLPAMPNGKLDRSALPSPDTAQLQAEKFEAPRTELESKLAAIWAEVLQVKRVGRTDDILKLGADSIHVFQITARSNREGIPLAAKQLFKFRNLAQLANALENAKEAERTAAMPRTHILANPSDYGSAGKSEASRPKFNASRSPFKPGRTIRSDLA